MNKLLIVKDGDKTRILLDDKEVKGVLDYNVKSSTNGLAELDLKIIVEFPVASSMNEIDITTSFELDGEKIN